VAYLRKLPSGRWQATVRHPSGKRFTDTFEFKRTAADWARDRQREFSQGVLRDPKAGRITVEEWGQRWFAARVVEATTRRKDEGLWRRYVKPRWGDWPVEAITRMDVQAWVRELTLSGRTVAEGTPPAGLAAATVHGIYQLLGAMLDAAVRDRVILSSPCARVDLPTIGRRLPQWFTDEQLDAVAGELAEPWSTMTLLMGWAGLRWGEAAGLDSRNVAWLRGRVEVVDVLTDRGQLRAYPKSKKSHREVPVPQPVLDRMSALMVGRPADGLVFVGPRGGPVHYPTFWWAWAPALERAKVPYANPHKLRHTAASRLVMAGVDLYRVQAFLGHESFATTQIYAHLAPDAHDAITAAWGSRRTSDARGGP